MRQISHLFFKVALDFVTESRNDFEIHLGVYRIGSRKFGPAAKSESIRRQGRGGKEWCRRQTGHWIQFRALSHITPKTGLILQPFVKKNSASGKAGAGARPHPRSMHWPWAFWISASMPVITSPSSGAIGPIFTGRWLQHSLLARYRCRCIRMLLPKRWPMSSSIVRRVSSLRKTRNRSTRSLMSRKNCPASSRSSFLTRAACANTNARC